MSTYPAEALSRLEIRITPFKGSALPRSLRQRVLSATKWTALSVAVVFGVQFVQLIVLARVLEVRQIGQIAVVTLVMGLADLVVATGVTQAIVQRRTVTSRELSSLYWLNLFVAASVAVVVLSTSGLVGRFFGDPAVVPLVQLASVMLLVSSFGQVARAMLEKRLRFEAIAVAEIAGAAVLLVVSVSTALAGTGSLSAVLGLIAGAVVRAAVYRTAARRLFRLRFVFHLQATRRFLGFSVLQSVDALINYVQNALSTATTGGVVGAAAMGGYNLSYNLAVNTPAKLNPVITRVMFPVFSSLQVGDRRMRSGYELMNLAVGLVSVPALTALALLAEPVLVTLYGSRWATFAPILAVLCGVGALRALGNPVGSVVMATDNMRLGVLVNAGKLVVTIPLIVVGGLTGGAVGAAVGVLLAQLVGLGVSALVLRRLIELSVLRYLATCGTPFLIAAPMVVLLLLVRPLFGGLPVPAALGLEVASAAAVLIVTVWVWPAAAVRELRRSFIEHALRRSAGKVAVAVLLPAEERFDGSGGAVSHWVNRVYRTSSPKARVYGPNARGPFAREVGARPLRLYDALLTADALLRRALGRAPSGNPSVLLRSGRIYLWSLRGRLLNADVVHVHNRPDYAIWLRARGYRGRIVLHMHNDLADYWSPDRSGLTAAVNTFIFCSEYLRAKAALEFGIASERTAVVHNGVDAAPTEAPSEPEPGHLVFAGRIVEEKGAAEAVRICARLLERGMPCRLSIVGGPGSGSRLKDSAYFQEVRAAAAVVNERYGAGTIVVHGHIAHQALQREMQSAWAFVYPCNWEEPFGLVVAEAMAVGLPVITYARGGIPEIVEDGVHGRVLDPGRGVEDFAVAIADLDSERRLEIAERSTADAQARFGWQMLAERTFALLERA